MVLGGSPQASYRDVELVDLDPQGNNNYTLPKPADLPQDMSGLVANRVGGQIIACGGRGEVNCYTYDFDLGRWVETASMDRARYGAVGFVVNDDLWFVLGGKDHDAENKPVLNSSITYNAGNFYSGDGLPYAAYFPCVASLNETHVFFAGGNDGTRTRKEAHILEVGPWTWTRLPDMRHERYRVSCGKVGNKIVVVGGDPNQDSSEVFSLDTLRWTEGPGVPTASGRFWACPQVYQMEDTFRLLGGYDGDGWLDTVFEFDPEVFGWRTMGERVARNRDSHGVVAVAEELVFR